MKILGAFLALISCVYMGLIKLKYLRLHISSLTAAAQVLELIRNELSINCDAMPELFEKLAERYDGITGCFFSKLCEGMSQLGARDFSLIWGENACAFFQSLTQDELYEFRKLAEVLGRCDIDKQLEALELCRQHLAASCADLKEGYPEKRKLIIGLSSAFGAMTVILLI